MKLLTRTSLYFLLIVIFAFAAGSVVYYIVLKNTLDEETREELQRKKIRVENYLDQSTDSIHNNVFLAEDVFFSIASAPSVEYYSDTLIYVKDEGEDLLFRQLSFTHKHNNSIYRVSIRKPVFESDDLFETLIISFSTILLILLAMLFIAQRIFFNRMWKPFFETLKKLNQYSPGEHALVSGKTNIIEFNSMNETVREMTERTYRSFQSVKSFSENAAHEIQTPLAVIISSAEILLQSPDLNPETAERTTRILSTAKKLSLMTRQMLMMTKIENHQYNTTEVLNISHLVRNKAETMTDLFEQKGMKVKITAPGEINIKSNLILTELIVSNLLSNALRHSDPDSTIEIEIDNSSLRISNQAPPMKLKPEQLFQRFSKNETSSESTGLGLSLIKTATDSLNWHIQYSYQSGSHTFEINWSHLQN